MGGSFEPCFAVAVPKTLGKRVKDALEAKGKLDKNKEISPFSARRRFEIVDGSLNDAQENRLLLPLAQQSGNDRLNFGSLSKLVEMIDMREHIASLFLVRMCLPIESQGDNSRVNLLVSTIDRWMHESNPAPGNGCNTSSPLELLLSHNWTYMVYKPLLLLPSSTLSALSSILAAMSITTQLSSLYPLLCDSFKITHIALNAPIPENIPTRPNISDPHQQKCSQQLGEGGCDHVFNILRSPTGLTPLYGDFGPNLALDHATTADDLASAFWCTAQQNRIFQTWAPRYTMFSRGNISEKARILTLNSLSIDQLKVDPQRTSAVDLYAGIGYFAFSYAKAGVGKVLCWEINPWSVEGLRRGACKNKWSIYTSRDDEAYSGLDLGPEKFLAFEESNQHAATRVHELRPSIPPVRHVNCGLLPSSNDSWAVAVQVLDPLLGGWIHAHENMAKKDIETRKCEITKIFTGLVEKHCDRQDARHWKVECEHVEQVKSYAPGVMHCVLDIALGPDNTA